MLRVNKRISLFFVTYQFINLVGSIVGPSTVLLLLADTFDFCFQIGLAWSFLLAIGPIVVYSATCLRVKNDTQIQLAAVMSTFYALLMVTVILGIICKMLLYSLANLTSVLFVMLVVIYLLASVVHPNEFGALLPSALYFLCLPSMFILLQIYAMFNMHNVSWGTREIKKDDEPKTVQKSGKKRNLMRLLKRIEEHFLKDDEIQLIVQPREVDNGEKAEKETISKRDWADNSLLEAYQTDYLPNEEKKFFDELIETHLTPLTNVNKSQIERDLIELRNKCSFCFCLINALWFYLIYNIKYFQQQYDLLTISFGLFGQTQRTDPLSIFFVFLFLIILLIQFFAMIWHRLKTVYQVVALVQTDCVEKFMSRMFSKTIKSALDEVKLNEENGRKVGEVNPVFDEREELDSIEKV